MVTKKIEDPLPFDEQAEQTRDLIVIPQEFRDFGMTVVEYQEYLAEQESANTDALFGVDFRNLIPRIKTPKSDGTYYEFPDRAPMNVFTAIPIHFQRRRAYWLNKKHPNWKAEEKAPVCSSTDLVTGSRPAMSLDVDDMYGNIQPPDNKYNGRTHLYGHCATCAMNQFGTSMDDSGLWGKGKGCKDSLMLFLFMEDKLKAGNEIPYLLTLSSTSLRAWDMLIGECTNLKQSPIDSIVKFEIETQNKAGAIVYATTKMLVVGKLSKDNPKLAVQLSQWRAKYKKDIVQQDIILEDVA
jgi:hypothetical protein